MKTKTYQLVLPGAAPELPAVHKFTRDASLLAGAPAGSVILVIEMFDDAFGQLTPEQIYA